MCGAVKLGYLGFSSVCGGYLRCAANYLVGSAVTRLFTRSRSIDAKLAGCAADYKWKLCPCLVQLVGARLGLRQPLFSSRLGLWQPLHASLLGLWQRWSRHSLVTALASEHRRTWPLPGPQVPMAQYEAARDAAAMLQRELDCCVPRAALQVEKEMRPVDGERVEEC